MSRSRPLVLILLLVTIGLGGLLILKRDQVMETFSLDRTLPFTNMSKAARGSDGALAVVIDSNKRIALVNPDGSLRKLIRSRNAPEHGFYFANEITLDPQGNLYVSSTYLDTSTLTVNREAIVRFSPRGRPEAVLYTIDHDPENYTDNIGLIRSLAWTATGLRFCVVREDGIETLFVDATTGEVLENKTTPLPYADVSIIFATVSDDGQRVAFSTAATELFIAATGEAPVLQFDGRALPGDEFSIPADLHFVADTLYFSDLGRDAIMRLTGKNQAEPVFNHALAEAVGYRDDFYECKSFQIDSDRLVLPNNGKVVSMARTEPPVITLLAEARGDATVWVRRAAWWLLLAAWAVAFFALIAALIRNASPESRRMAKQVALVALMVGTAVGITTYMIFTNMNQRLEQEARNSLLGYLEVGRIVMEVDTVDRIRHVRDYMNDDYQAVLEQLRQTITREGTINASTYSGVYKVFDDKLSALAYHDGLRGIFYPYDYQYSDSIYAKVAETGEPYIGEIIDIYGIWLNGVIALTNQVGATVGFLEVGVDQSAQREANRALFTSTLIDLSMILFVLLFVFFEIGHFSSHVLDQAEPTAASDEGTIRFVSFLAITGVFLSASFLPLFSKSLAPVHDRIPLDIMIGLPMVLETLCGAVVAVLYGHLRIRTGLKLDIILACLAIAGGMVVTGLAQDFEQLMLGRVLVGMGMGLLMIAFRTYFLIERDAYRKEAGIIALTAGVVAGINTGSVSGGMLADRMGMAPVFYLQAVLMVVAALAAALLVRNRHRPPATAKGTPGALSPWRFVADRAVWSFFLFAFLPVTACGLFLGFLFPLFAEAQGNSINEISLAFMLFGATTVYLGPALTRLTSTMLGPRRAIITGMLLMTGALLLFAHFQTLAAAYVTIILFGLTDSFVFNQGLSYFASLPGVRRFGEDKAMGVYNVFESSGEALGPLAFGLAASLSLGPGIAVIAATLGVSMLAFWAFTPKSETPPS